MILPFALLSLVTVAAPLAAANAANDGAQNPFACLGGYESLTGRRSLAQIRHELEVYQDRLQDADIAPAQRAVDLCVIAKLEARLGHSSAAESFRAAIEAAPAEPGFELFAGMYWAGMRGARRPVLERAEGHFYAGLAKLAALAAGQRRRAFHDVVEQWLHKQLLLLYQQDGAPLLPARAHPQDAGGKNALGLHFSTQLRLARDTRDFFYNNEARQFTGEATFAASDLRAANMFNARDAWDIARAPVRWQSENRLRLRHRLIGAIDLLHLHHRAADSQITSFYDPNQGLSDVAVSQYGLGFERVLPLYPLFDLRLAGSYRRTIRRGVVEFEPELKESFNQLELRPSVSRFLGAHNLTIDGVYVRLDLADTIGGPRAEQLREKVIRAVRVDFALYSPLTLPSWRTGWFGFDRTPIRGWHFYAGAAEDEEVYGLRTVVARDLYAGTRFEGSERLDFTLQGTHYAAHTEKVNPNDRVPRLYSEPGLAFSSARATLVTQVRLINPDAIPGMPATRWGVGADMLNLVIPLHYEQALTGRTDYENLRAGAELWLKLLAPGLGGSTFLLTLGYEAQYFHRLDKVMHLGHMAIRLGWGDL